MTGAVLASHAAIGALAGIEARAPAHVILSYRAAALPPASPPLRLVGAWTLSAPDPRFTGLSALAIDGGQFLTVTDRGAVARFDFPFAARPAAWLADLRDGPGPWGAKQARDAESLARDGGGRGWWVGFEQSHALYLYDPDFLGARTKVDLGRERWPSNRGAEGLLAWRDGLVIFPEAGRELVAITPAGSVRSRLAAGGDVADVARAPDGSSWLLLRSWTLAGIRQALAPLEGGEGDYRIGRPLPVPGGVLDNFEGLAIEQRPGGIWRFWLVSDDGHRILARTLLVALDYAPGANKKSPAPGAGLVSRPRAGKRL